MTISRFEQLEQFGYSPGLGLVVHDPNYVPDPDDANHIAVKRITLGDIATKLIDWDMQTNISPAKLHDIELNQFSRANHITNNLIESGGGIHLLRLGSVDLSQSQNYYAIAALYEKDTTVNNIRIVIGPVSSGLSYGHISFENGVGLVWGNSQYVNYSSIIDPDYVLGDYFAIFINTQTKVISVVTQTKHVNTLVTAVNKAITSIGISYYVSDPESLQSSARVYLSSDPALLAQVPRILNIPSIYDSYTPIVEFDEASLPSDIKIGDCLKSTNSGIFHNVSYLKDEYAQVISLSPPIVFPISDAQREVYQRIFVNVPNDLPNLDAVVQRYSQYQFGTGGQVVVQIEPTYVLSDIDQLQIGNDLGWLYIEPKDNTTHLSVTNADTLVTILPGGRLGSFSGSYKYMGSAVSPRLLDIFGELLQTSDMSSGLIGGLEAINYPLGAFNIAADQLGSYVKLKETVLAGFSYANTEGSKLVNFYPTFGSYTTNKKRINVLGRCRVGVINESLTDIAYVNILTDQKYGLDTRIDIQASGLINCLYETGSVVPDRLTLSIGKGSPLEGFANPPRLSATINIKANDAYVNLDSIVPNTGNMSICFTTANRCKLIGRFSDTVPFGFYQPSNVFLVGPSVFLDARNFERDHIDPLANSNLFARVGVGAIPANLVQPNGTLCLR